MSTASATMPSLNTPAAAAPAQQDKPKPCCVCKDEKAKRDECMLFSSASDPAKECRTTIQSYKDCMKGFGFDV